VFAEAAALQLRQLLLQTRHEIVELIDDRAHRIRLAQVNARLAELLHGVIVAPRSQQLEILRARIGTPRAADLLRDPRG
jgi:hypothetical protein